MVQLFFPQSSKDVTRLYVCNSCDADFNEKEKLVSHFKSAHTGVSKNEETPARLASATNSHKTAATDSNKGEIHQVFHVDPIGFYYSC